MKNLLLSLFVSTISLSLFAQPRANFTTDKFENFTLHTYASFDAMADVSFIVEGKDSLVVIEPQAFDGNVEEFVNYTKTLNKPIAKVLVSFHPAGLKVYQDECKVISKPMAGFLQSDAAKGMLAYFDKAFNGTMDTEIVRFDAQVDAVSVFSVDGVDFTLEPTSLPGMPGVNIAIGDQVYYQHFAPATGFHASKNQIKSIASIEGALVDAMKAKKGKYTLLLGAHGVGKASIEDLKFQIKYLKTMKRIASKTNTADEFFQQMEAKYENCKGEQDLKAIAVSLYQ